jgi:circadian clock protein KaiC
MLQDRLSTGISGLDEVLHTGLLSGRAYLVRGGPGTGKTTFGLHFLAAGIAKGEQVLYITLGEPAEQIRLNAEQLGFNSQEIAFSISALVQNSSPKSRLTTSSPRRK